MESERTGGTLTPPTGAPPAGCSVAVRRADPPADGSSSSGVQGTLSTHVEVR